jgi:Holliday junction resolvasome RuvABC endonuclease subunit
MKIRIAGFDPSLTGCGLAKLDYEIETGKLELVELKLVATQPETAKQVRRSSSDLRRANVIATAMVDWMEDCKFFFGEVPSGSQSNRAAITFGIVIGLFGMLSHIKPMFEVQPSETKLITVGTKTASKEEMVEWAMEHYPDAPWMTRTLKGKQVPIAANHNLADAIAVAYAGVRLTEFKRAVALQKAVA